MAYGEASIIEQCDSIPIVSPSARMPQWESWYRGIERSPLPAIGRSILIIGRQSKYSVGGRIFRKIDKAPDNVTRRPLSVARLKPPFRANVRRISGIKVSRTGGNFGRRFLFRRCVLYFQRRDTFLLDSLDRDSGEHSP